MQLTLFIPELIWPEPEELDALDGVACPALSALLARGQHSRGPVQAHEAALSTLFDNPAEVGHAPFRLLGETHGAPGTLAQAVGIDRIFADLVGVAADLEAVPQQHGAGLRGRDARSLVHGRHQGRR